ncbi:MAG TPA: hypothetical protein VH541_05600 [Gaiellaceae bacterium]|jgi:hypothetical protein
MGSDEQIEAPVEFPDEAFEPDNGSLSVEQFALRVNAKREQAYQDAGWTVPPGAEGDPEALEPIEDEEGEAEEPEPELAPEETEPAPETEEGEEPDFYVGRYKTREAAEEGLREKDETINRIFRELHEQRQQIEQALQEEAEPAQLDAAAWQEWAETAVEARAGPDGAIQALRTGGQQGYNVYLRAWMDDDEQRADALAFNNQVMLELAEQRARQAIMPFTEDMQARTRQAEAVAAKERVAERYPDFDEYKDEMDRLIEEEGALPEETKVFLATVASTGLQGKVQAWEYLYMAAARNRAPRRAKAATAEAGRRRTSADQAKVQAMVSTAEGAAARTPLSAAELAVIRRKNELRKEWDLPLLPEE